jgi:NAD(P)-dependent dehydrogenase (short-subunit alcohol dehydrogenase family)
MARFDPRGRVAVVTGASSGIGEATVRRLAEAGMTVVATARRLDRLRALAAELERVEAHALDVNDLASVDALADHVRRVHGACHVLVNDAGIGGGDLGGREGLEAALHVVDTNLLGTMRVTAAFAALLAESAPARVVNVASVAGKLGIGPSPYVASKFGMVGLSEALDLAWSSRGIRVSQVNPGFIATEGFPQTWTHGTPLARVVGRPDDVARAIVRVVVRGTRERTVPRWYRPLVVLRHTAAPLVRWIGAAASGPRQRYDAGRSAVSGSSGSSGTSTPSGPSGNAGA